MYERPNAGPPPGRSVRRRTWKIAAIATVTGGIVIGTASYALAQGSASAPAAPAASSTVDPDASGVPWDGSAVPWAGHWAGAAGWTGAIGGGDTILHAQGVATKSGGGTETVLIQRGDVTSVSSSSISLKSSDGFTATYQVTSATQVNCNNTDKVSSIANGTSVVVIATQSGGQTTATEILGG